MSIPNVYQFLFSVLSVSTFFDLYVVHHFHSISILICLSSDGISSNKRLLCSVHSPLGADGFVVVHENLLSLKFNLRLGTMYVEQELFQETGELCKTVLIQRSREDSGSFWSLGAGSYKLIGLSELEMDASTMLLTNESITTALQSPCLRKIKVEPGLEDVMVLSDSDDDNIQVVDLAGESSFPFQSKCSLGDAASAQAPPTNDPSPHKPLHLSIGDQHTRSKKPHVHPASSISIVHILDALKITKCRRRSKSDLTNIDFDNIVIEDVKYLPSAFDGDVLFILPPVNTGIPDAYGKAMDGMDKIYDGHAWCRTKTTNIQNEFGLTFRRSSCVGHLQCPNQSCEYPSRKVESAIVPNGSVLHRLHSWLV